MPTRRTFLATSALGLAATLLPAAALSLEEDISLHIFSKHLQFLNYAQAAEAAREMGFAGLDLTVRPGGHVAPERVSEELPQAVAEMKKQGLRPHMMTTALTEADASSATLLKEAHKAGFSIYRSGWLSYPEHVPVPVSLEKYKGQLATLAALSAEHGMQGAYQNHTGNYLGAAVWDLWEVLKDLPPGTFGSQYDIRHATVEGGNAWYQNLRLIAPYINSLAIKDFIWQKTGSGWQAVSVPIGEGMVDFLRFFRFLRQQGIRVPMSLHMEYPLGGAENGQTRISLKPSEVFQAMKTDAQKVRELWERSAE